MNVSRNATVQTGIRQRSLRKHCRVGRATELVFVLATGVMLTIGGAAEAQDRTWNGGDGGTWAEDDGNLDWINTTPAAADFSPGDNAVFVVDGETIIVDTTDDEVNVNNIDFNADNIIVNGPDDIALANRIFNDLGQTATINADFSTNAATTAGGDLNLSGTIAGELGVDGTGTVTLTGTAASLETTAGTTVISTGGVVTGLTQITNSTVTVSGGNLGAGDGGSIVSDLVRVNTGGLVDVDSGDVGFIILQGGDADIAGGTIAQLRSEDAAGSTTMTAGTITGLTDIDDGTFNFNGGALGDVDNAASFVITEDEMVGGDFINSGTIDASGATEDAILTISGATGLTHSGDVTTNAVGDTLTITAAEIILNNTAQFDGAAEIGGDVILNGAITNNTTMTVVDPLTLVDTLTNIGTLDVNAAITGGDNDIANSGTLDTVTGSDITGVGLLTNSGAGQINGTGTISSATFTNSGTASLGAGTTVTSAGAQTLEGGTIAGDLDGAGAVTVQTGTTGVTGSITNATTLAVTSGALNITGTGSIDTANNDTSVSGGVLTTDGDGIADDEVVSVSGSGTLFVDGADTIAALTQTGGNVSGDSALEVTGAFNQSAGTTGVTIDINAGTFTQSGTGIIAAGTFVTSAGAQSLNGGTISGTLDGASAITVATGTTNLDGGAITNATSLEITTGTLAETNAGSIDTAANLITISGAGTLSTDGNGIADDEAVALTGTGNLTVDGTDTIASLDQDNGTVNGAGTLTVSGLYDQAGANATTGGTVTVSTDTFNQSGGATIADLTTVNATGLKTLSGGTIAGTLGGAGTTTVDTGTTTLASTGTLEGGAVTVDSTGTIDTQGGTLTADLTLDGGTVLASEDASITSGTVTLSSAANGGTLLAQAGDTLTVSPTTLNTGDGALTVGDGTNTGTVVLSAGANTAVAGSSLNVNGGTLQFGIAETAANLYSGNSGAAAQNTVVAAAGTIDLNDFDTTLADLSGAGTITNSGSGTPTLTIDALNDTTFSGVIEDGAGGGTTALEKDGGGVTTLSGANTYTDATDIISGELAVTGAGTLASTDINITDTGSELSTDGGALAAAADVSVSDGTFDVDGDETIAVLDLQSGTTEIDAAATLNIGGTGTTDSTIDGTVNGSGTLNIEGNTTTVGSSGSITADTEVSGGELINNGSVASLLNSGGLVTLGDLSTTDSLTQNGMATSTTVLGTATVTGLTDIDVGSLIIASGNTLNATGGVDMASGTTLDLGGTVAGDVTSAGALSLQDGSFVGTLTQTGGTTTITGTANVTGDLNANGGTFDLNGSGTVLNVGGTATGAVTAEIDTNLNNMSTTDASSITGVADPNFTLNVDLGAETGTGDFIDAVVLQYSGSNANLTLGTVGANGLFTNQGPLDYFLEDDGAGTVTLAATTTSAVSSVAATVGLTQTLVNTIVNRPTSPFVADLAAGAEEDPCGAGVWTRVTGGTANADGTFTDVTSGRDGQSPVGLNYSGFQFGGDVACFGGHYNGWDMAFGGIAGFNNASAASTSSDSVGNPENTLESDILQKYAGVYVTAARGRFFADLQFRFEDTEFDNTIQNISTVGGGLSDSVATYDNTGQTLSGAVGYSWQIGSKPNLTFVSSAGFSFSENETDDVTLGTDGTLSFDDGSTRVGFLSASIANTVIRPNEISLLSYFGTATLYNDYADDRRAVFTLADSSTRDLDLENLGAYGELSLGVNYLTLLTPGQAGNARQLNASVRVDARFSGDIESYGITGQLRLQF